MKRTTAIVALLSLVLTIVGLSQGMAHKRAPNFTLKAADGSTVELAKLKGKVVVVNFWATWCPPCRAEIPDFVELSKAYKSKGVEFIGIALDEEGWSAVQPFIQKNKITYPIVLPDQRVAANFGGIEAIPTTFVIDKSGTIAEEHVGGISRASLEKVLQRLL